jgi:succinoglycan biosynthesis transport protein ExoP
VELKRILRILLRRKWLAVQAFLIIFLTVLIGSLLLKPVWETSAKLWFKPPTVTPSLLSSIGLKEISPFIPIGPSQVDISTKVTLAQVTPLVEKVIYRLQIRDKHGKLYSAAKLLKTSILSMILPAPNITVIQDPDSNTISITADSTDILQAIFMANTLAEVYTEDSENERRKETQSARIFIEGQLAMVKENYNKVLNDILSFKDKYNTVNLEIETRIAIEKIAELMKQKEDNIINISEVREKIKTLKEQLRQTAVANKTAPSVPALILKENPQIQKLMQDLSQFKSKLAGELTDKTESHPDVIVLKQQIKELEKELEREVQIHQVTAPELDDLDRQLAALKAHLDGVNLDVDKYTRLLRTLPSKSTEEEKLKLTLMASQGIYSSLLDYSNRIGVAEAMTLPDAKLVQSAIRPDKPKSPVIVLNAIIGAFMGLIFSLGLVFLAEYIDDTIKTPDEIEQYKGLPFLGSIPQIIKSKLIARTDANDPVCEAYRAIRYNLKYASLDKPFKSFLISSSNPKEGRTLTVANLGISFSQTGFRVLLIDTDLRRPRLHELFEKLNHAGLTSVVVGEFGWEAIVDTGINNLSLLPSGPTPLDPGRIFESERLKELIAKLNSRFDLLIFDAAPLLIKSDAIVLGRYVDGIIYVLESGKTSHKAIRESIDVLQKANMKVLGTILNRYGKKKKDFRNREGRKKRRGILRRLFVAAFVTVLITGVSCSSPLFNPNIKEYFNNLKSPNTAMKREAIYQLGELQVEEAVPQMIGLLSKETGETLADTIEALGKIGDPAAVNPLLRMLNNDNILVREKTVEALGRIGDKRAVPALVSALEQKDNRSETEVFTAIWALGNIGDRSAVPILNSLLEDKNKYVRYLAMEALNKLSAPSE